MNCDGAHPASSFQARFRVTDDDLIGLVDEIKKRGKRPRLRGPGAHRAALGLRAMSRRSSSRGQSTLGCVTAAQ